MCYHNLVPPLIEAYGSGERVTTGSARIDPVGSRCRPASAWPGLSRLPVHQAGMRDADGGVLALVGGTVVFGYVGGRTFTGRVLD